MQASPEDPVSLHFSIQHTSMICLQPAKRELRFLRTTPCFLQPQKHQLRNRSSAETNKSYDSMAQKMETKIKRIQDGSGHLWTSKQAFTYEITNF